MRCERETPGSRPQVMVACQIHQTGVTFLSPSGPYSALMFANLTTLPHLSISSAMTFANSAGDPASGPRTHVGKVGLLRSTRIGLISAVELVDNRGGRIPGRADSLLAAILRMVSR